METTKNTPAAIDYKTMIKVFMQYWGQKFIYTAGNECELLIRGCSLVNGIYVFVIEQQSTLWPIGGCVIELKPLGEISKEDRAKVVEILQIKDVVNITVGAFLQELLKSEYNTYRADFTLQAIDFLRSRGYALPYGEYSVEQLVEAGIYKLILPTARNPHKESGAVQL